MVVPSKVKIFVWRLARHSLPTTDVQKHRNMAEQDACPLCGCVDSWRHALISCTNARCTWALTDDNPVSKMTANTESSAKSWLFEMNDVLDQKEFARMVITLWFIWYARRKAIHEAIFQSPYQVFSFVNSYINQLPKAGAIKPASVPSSNLQQRWIPPPIHTQKINVDGVVARHRRGGAVAAICRDHSVRLCIYVASV